MYRLSRAGLSAAKDIWISFIWTQSVQHFLLLYANVFWRRLSFCPLPPLNSINRRLCFSVPFFFSFVQFSSFTVWNKKAPDQEDATHETNKHVHESDLQFFKANLHKKNSTCSFVSGSVVLRFSSLGKVLIFISFVCLKIEPNWQRVKYYKLLA